MSRSRRKRPYRGVCADSEKWAKQKNNRRLRKKCKIALRRDAEVLPKMNEISDPWLMPKDGRIYLDKTSERYKKNMRK